MKKVKTGLAALAAVASFGVAHAANWMPTNISGVDEGVITIDASSIQLQPGDVVQAWFKTEYSQPQYINGRAYTSKKFIDRFFCGAHTVSYGPQYAYDSTGQVVATSGGYDAPVDPIPESVADGLMNLTCEVAARMKAAATKK
jgi:hypothetical protein